MLLTILHRLFKSTPPALPALHDEQFVLDDADAEADAEQRSLGCGWFDSSHELQCGLVVTEHASADAVANDLPLSDWLGLHLGGRVAVAEVGLA